MAACGHCGGSGMVVIGGVEMACGVCKGKGRTGEDEDEK